MDVCIEVVMVPLPLIGPPLECGNFTILGGHCSSCGVKKPEVVDRPHVDFALDHGMDHVHAASSLNSANALDGNTRPLQVRKANPNGCGSKLNELDRRNLCVDLQGNPFWGCPNFF